jgi:hypothetical protein
MHPRSEVLIRAYSVVHLPEEKVKKINTNSVKFTELYVIYTYIYIP